MTGGGCRANPAAAANWLASYKQQRKEH